jgi:hypothetical protein
MPEALIETAIGLFLVFLLMSLIASQLVEWIAGWRKWRAEELEKTIRAMLSEGSVKEKLDESAQSLASKLYAHPLISSLAKPGSKPSYIPAGKYALALFDVITTAGSEASTIGHARAALEQVKAQLLTQLPKAAVDELQSLTNQIQGVIKAASAAKQTTEAINASPLPPTLDNELKGFLERYGISPAYFNALAQSINVNSDILLARIQGGTARLSTQSPELAQTINNLFFGLDSQLSQGEKQLAAARRNIEQWYNDAMDRANGWYKRHIQLWLAVIAFIVALILNVDAIYIATTLWRDPTLRENIVQQAQMYQLPSSSEGQSIATLDQAEQSIRDLSMKLSQDLRLPIGWRIEAYPLQPNMTCSLLPLKAGEVWGIARGTECVQIFDAVPNPNAGLISKLIGLLITALAATQGAPFWFDMLQKAVNMRSAGVKPDENKPAEKKTAENK